VQDGRFHIEKTNGPFIHEARQPGGVQGGGRDLANDRGWLWPHASGTYAKFTPARAELLAR
jgi:hypothetical protein